ncbi:hypothetical protein D9M68_724540 [compost metagenome]
MLGRLGHLFSRLHTHVHQDTRHVVLHRVQQLAEQHEGLALVLLLGLLLGVATQVNALTQIVESGQMLAPLPVDGLQQHDTLELGEVLFAHDLHFAIEHRFGSGHHTLGNLFGVDRLRIRHPGRHGHINCPLLAQHALQRGQVPLFLDAAFGHVFVHQIGKAAVAQRINLGPQRLGIQNIVALLVDHLALIIGHVVVFEQLLANVEVASLDLALRTLDASRDDASLDGLTLRHLQSVHDRSHAIAGKDSHQRVIQAQVEARGTRVALAA